MQLILAFIFLLNDVNAFIFRQCNRNNDCIGSYPGSSFTSLIVNNIFDLNSGHDFFYITPSDDESEITINFDEINSSLSFYFEKPQAKDIKLILETKASDFTKRENYPKIYANLYDIIIDNQNDSIDKSVVPYGTFSYNSLSSKNKDKPLHLYLETIYYTNFDYIKDSIVYLSAFDVQMNIYEPTDRTIHIYFIDSFIYSLGGYNQGTEIRIKTYLQCNHYYSTEFLRIGFSLSDKYYFIHATSPKIQIINDLAPGCIVDGPFINNIFSGSLIYPHLIYKNSSLDYPSIIYNWPFMERKYYEGYTHEDGRRVFSFEKNCYLEGTFIFGSESFYLDDFKNLKLIILDESNINTSLYLNNGELFDKTINIEYSGANTNMIIGGEPLNLKGSSMIQTSSSNLKLFINSVKPIRHSGPATIIYMGIDNSNYDFNEIVNFQESGTIKIPYGINKNALFDEITNIYDDYLNTNPSPETKLFSDLANHYIDFVNNKIDDLSSLINNLENTISPVTIWSNPLEDFLKDDKSKLVFTRQDLPFSLLYQKNLNKQLKAVCFENSKISREKWQVKFNNQISQSLYNLFDFDLNEDLSRYYPQISDSSIKGNFIDIDENCIGFEPTSIPSSTIDLFVYTENQTYIEILSKLNVINLLTSSDLDAYSKLSNKNSMNIVILVLDDLPNGKSINLNGVRQDANIFLIGYKSSSIDDLYELIDVLRKNDNDLEKREKLSQILGQYTNYQVKASLTYNGVQTLCLGLINYVGTHIRCVNFISFLSSLSNIDKDFTAINTLIDSVSYKMLLNVKLTNLILFPVALDPVDFLMVEQINFTSSQWKLLLNGYYNEEIPDDYKTYTINTDKVSGKFYLYSITDKCKFNIPHDEKVTTIKGISLVSDFLNNFNIRTIPGIMILEDALDSQKINKITNHLKKSTLLEDESATQISFTGNWEDVTTIQGNIEINSGTKRAAIENVPEIVVQSFDVKSEKSFLLETNTEEMKFNQPQIFMNNKAIKFSNKNMQVSFSNITLAGSENTDFTLLLGNEKSKVVTDSITVNEDVSGKINGDLEVKQTFELGPGSSLEADSISTNNPTLILNYRLKEDFALIPNIITEPKSVILNYIGENDDIDMVTDYSIYGNTLKNIKKFDDKNVCLHYLNVIKFESKLYPEFRGENSIITLKCEINEQILRMNITKIPTGEIEIPPIEPIIPPPPNDSPEGNNKKKFPIGGIIGIVIGLLVVIAVVIVLLWFFVFRKKKDNKSENEGNDQNDQSNI